MTLEMFLATEAARAKSADKGLGWVLGEGLLATSAVDRCSAIATIFGVRGGGVAVVRAWLALRCVGVWCLLLTLTVTVDVCVYGRHAVIGISFRVVSLHAVCFSVIEVFGVLGEGRARWRGQTGVCAAVFLIKAEALHAFKILLFTNLQFLTLLTVVGNVGLSKVDKAELVLGVEFRAEGRFESWSARAATEGIGDVVFRSDRVDGGAEGKFMLFVLGGQGWQRWKLRSGSHSDSDCRVKGR